MIGEALGAAKAAWAALVYWVCNFPTLVRLTWLPLLLLSLIGFGWQYWSGEAAYEVTHQSVQLQLTVKVN